METVDALQELSTPRVVAAKEASDEQFGVGLGRGAGGELHDEPALLWYISGFPSKFFNGVSRTRLPAEEADAAITATLAHFRRRGVPMCWKVTPSTRPGDLGPRLETRGLHHAASVPQLALDLHTLGAAPPAPPGVTIHGIEDGESLEPWIAVFCSGAPPQVREACLPVYTDLSARLPFRHFLGLLDGAPVATSSVLLTAGVGVVHHVVTVPSARRRGIGTAMTLAAAHAARGAGYRIAALGSSAMALGMYRRLGFREQCRFDFYEWHP